jgi:hypothetical protein
MALSQPMGLLSQLFGLFFSEYICPLHTTHPFV